MLGLKGYSKIREATPEEARQYRIEEAARRINFLTERIQEDSAEVEKLREHLSLLSQGIEPDDLGAVEERKG